MKDPGSQRNAVEKSPLVAVRGGVSAADIRRPEHRIPGNTISWANPVRLSAGSEGEWIVVHESSAGHSLLIALVQKVGTRFEVTVMGDPLRMVSVDSLSAAVDQISVDELTARRLRTALLG